MTLPTLSSSSSTSNVAPLSLNSQHAQTPDSTVIELEVNVHSRVLTGDVIQQRRGQILNFQANMTSGSGDDALTVVTDDTTFTNQTHRSNTELTPDKWIDDLKALLDTEKAQKTLDPGEVFAVYQAQQKQLHEPDARKRDWSETKTLLMRAYGISAADVKAGATAAGKIYPYASTLSQVILSWIPSAIGAYATGVPSLPRAGLAFGLQTAITLSAPWMNTISHLFVVPAQELLYQGSCKKPTKDLAPTLEQATGDMLLAQQELQELNKKLESTDGNEALETYINELAPAVKKLENALGAYGRSVEVNKVQEAGQYYQNIGRCMRTLINGTASFYGLATGDTKGAFWIQFGGMLATTVYGQWASKEDARNKMDQQFTSMLTVLDFCSEEGKQFPLDGREARHMKCELLAKQLDLPGETVVKLTKTAYDTQLKFIDQAIAKEHNLTLVGWQQHNELTVKADTGELTTNERNRLDWLTRKMKEPSSPAAMQKVAMLQNERGRVSNDIRHLGREEFNQISTDNRRILQVMAESLREKEKGTWFPINQFLSVSPFNADFSLTKSAQAAWFNGLSKVARGDEIIPMAVGKAGAYAQMGIGGSGTPQVLSSFLKLVQEGLRNSLNNPDYVLPQGLRYSVGTFNLLVGAGAAFASSDLINVKTRQRDRLKERINEGRIDLPVGFGKNLMSGAFWKTYFGDLNQSMWAFPSGIKDRRQASTVENLANNTRNHARQIVGGNIIRDRNSIVSGESSILINFDDVHSNDIQLQTMPTASTSNRIIELEEDEDGNLRENNVA